MRKSVANQLADAAERLLAQSLEQPLTVAVIARKVGTNLTTLKSAFKGRYGIGVARYGRMLRLQEARRLLQATDWAVERVALATGFCDGPGLTAAFKKRFGTPPAKWRSAIERQPVGMDTAKYVLPDRPL